MIKVWTQNDLFHDSVTVILTSQMAVKELDDDNDDDERPLVVRNC